MERVSLCPFTSGEIVWQAQGGAWTLSICVKATFALVHDAEAKIADVQDPIGPDELVPFKPKVDVVLVGHAHAPEARPVDALVARFSLGEYTKAIGIVGDRVWREGPDGLEPSPPAPFVAMPLTYARAAGGRDNPAGVDLRKPSVVGEIALPNLEAADEVEVPGRVAGVGPIDARWPARRSLLDEASLAWTTDRRGPMPDNFEFRYFNVAPADQQLALLRHGAIVALENLNPTAPQIVSRLPLIRPKAFLVDEATERATEVALRCDTVILDGDRAAATLLFRGLVGIDGPDPAMTVVVAAESPQKRLHYRDIERMLADGTTSSISDPTDNGLGRRHDWVLGEGPKVATPVPPSWNAPPPSRPGTLPRLREPEPESVHEAVTARVIFDAPTSRESMQSITIAEDGWGPGIDDFVTEEQPPRPTKDLTGEVDLPEYVRITVQIERGEVGDVLNQYKIGLAELAALRASWSERLDADADLANDFDLKLTAARRRA